MGVQTKWYWLWVLWNGVIATFIILHNKVKKKKKKHLLTSPPQPLLHFFPPLSRKILPKGCLYSNLPVPILFQPTLTCRLSSDTHHHHSSACQNYHCLHVTKSIGQFYKLHTAGYSFFTWFPGHYPVLVFSPTLLILPFASEMLKCPRTQFLVLLSFLYHFLKHFIQTHTFCILWLPNLHL